VDEVILMAVVHVDDILLIGKKTVIEKFKSDLQKRVNTLGLSGNIEAASWHIV
jgi:hypothetical protein